jgi:DnaJ-class molecular chaperone
VRQLIELTGKATYYQLLEVTSDSPAVHVKKSYYSLVRKFHPDNHMGSRELITPLKNLMVVISEAYKTLGNEEKRAAYDKRLAAMGGFSMHREKNGGRGVPRRMDEPRQRMPARAEFRGLDRLAAQMP